MLFATEFGDVLFGDDADDIPAVWTPRPLTTTAIKAFLRHILR